MNAVRLTAAGLLVVGVVASLRADEKKADANAAKIVGTWEVVKCEAKRLPVGTVFELAQDGKVKATFKMDGKDKTVVGSYTVTGDKLAVTMKRGEKEESLTVTIKKMSDAELTAETENGKKVEFKRKK